MVHAAGIHRSGARSAREDRSRSGFSPAAQKVVQAGRFFSKQDDGSKQRWHGRVWLNPPYAQPGIALFASKLIEEWNAGKLVAAIAVTHNYTSSAWFANLPVPLARSVSRASGSSSMKATSTRSRLKGQAFFYFGKDVRGFERIFRKIGFGAAPLWQYDADDDGEQ